MNNMRKNYGIDEFLKKEEQALLSIDVENTVIATGGSAVYSDAAMKHLAAGSTVVYLNVPEGTQGTSGRRSMENGITSIRRDIS